MAHVARPDLEVVEFETLTARFRPVFAQIAAGAVARERQRDLAHDAVRSLANAGFGAVRIPTADGGGGASIPQFFRLLIALGAADSNLPQALRAHFGMVEERLYSDDSDARDKWLRRVVDGAVIGNATTEIGGGKVGSTATRLDTSDDTWAITGIKFYSTGALYADWLAIGVADERDEKAFAIVSAADPGLRRVDDWNGFGQRLTASGTTHLDAVPVEPEDVFWYAERGPNYMIAFYQLVLLASLAGIGRAVVTDAVAYVQARKRVFSHSGSTSAREDPLVQQVIGRLQAASFAADAVTLAAVDALERVNAARAVGQPLEPVVDAAELATSTAHGTVVDAVLGAATLLFEVGGASSVDSDKALDRHWRNARTISVHNPGIYKQRAVGDHLLNGTAPTHAWVVGTAS
jgi:alkylation response protein AidB-like acyl-CoA dehydrogenase